MSATPALGPVMLDLAGTILTDEERELLRHPLVGGVILFSRNYADPEQLCRLTAEIHAAREPRLLIAVDHEGGRVQRFREGFSRLPAMRGLGLLWDRDREAALAGARATGYVLAAELRACGVDLSFAPVLDLDYGPSTVIGDRALHREPEAVAQLAGALIDGLAEAGMGAVGKHFPGHGFVSADSHVAVPVDTRSYDQIAAADMAPYRTLAPRLAGVMPAHIVFEQVDRMPAGYSRSWLQTILRQRLGFDGVVFSDDLSMEGARVAGGVAERAQAALTAGCDMVLVCNDAASARELLERWQPRRDEHPARRLARLLPASGAPDRRRLAEEPRYLASREAMGAVPVLPIAFDGCSPPAA
jgi:beta-N-acetylhexosaminidase